MGNSSSSSSIYSHDVFISFRGPDTRKRFIGYLYPKLCEIKKAKIFMDEPKIEPGDQISETLIKAIQESRIGLVVFSPDYASSTHCLDELAYIVERSIDQNHMFFVPVFYDVQPSILHKKDGSFEEALTKHEIEAKVEKHKIDEWRAALKKAAGVAGFTSNNYRFDSSLIDDIATCITKKLSELREREKKISEMMKLFSFIDKDGDGYITAKEFRSYGLKGTEVDLQEWIDRYDVDGNGTIDFPEFVKLLNYKII